MGEGVVAARGGSVALIGGALLWALWPAAAPTPERVPGVRVARVPTGEVTSHAPLPRVEAPDAPLPPRVDAVVEGCGLDVWLRCDPQGACGAVARMPDVDGPVGWATLSLSHPRFVGATVARELGLGDAWNPCVGAAAELGRVWSVDLEEGGELWCAGDYDLCDAEALSRWGVGMRGVRRRVRSFASRHSGSTPSTASSPDGGIAPTP